MNNSTKTLLEARRQCCVQNYVPIMKSVSRILDERDDMAISAMLEALLGDSHGGNCDDGAETARRFKQIISSTTPSAAQYLAAAVSATLITILKNREDKRNGCQ